MDFKEKQNYNFNDLVEIVKILRSPGGCPWDREQTHKSIRSNFIEETYEAIEAIDTDDTAERGTWRRTASGCASFGN